jgi:hypothetical protein
MIIHALCQTDARASSVRIPARTANNLFSPRMIFYLDHPFGWGRPSLLRFGELKSQMKKFGLSLFCKIVQASHIW